MVLIVLIERGIASLHELKTIYDSEDAWNMVEAILVRGYNQKQLYEEEKKRHAR